MKRSQTQLAAALAVVWFGGAAATQAADMTLADLLVPGASLSNSDLTFFGFQNVTQIGTLSVPLDQIYVIPIWGGPGGSNTEPGLRFQSAFWTISGALQTYDLAFEFSVRSTSFAPILTDNTLALTGSGVGTGLAQVVEGVIDSGSSATLANKFVYVSGSGNNLVDHDIFPGGPYTTLQIRKDFVMSTGVDPQSRVFVSDFDQTFSTVPEASPGLAGIGLALLAGRQILRRRAPGGVDTLAV